MEENDPVKNNYRELCGELLLESCYTILPNAIQKKEITYDTSSISQFKIEEINSTMQNNQVKNLCSEHESMKRKETLARYYHSILILNFVNLRTPYFTKIIKFFFVHFKKIGKQRAWREK